MKLKYWLKPGLGIKRLIFEIILGVSVIVYSLIRLIQLIEIEKIKLVYIAFIIIGLYACYDGLRKYGRKMISFGINDFNMKNSTNKSVPEFLYEKNILAKGPKIVVIGGGTGLSNLLTGLKLYTSNITAIVTVADDGGGSGMLRKDLGMLPPGDIRNCITALAYTEPIMEELFQYRFKDGSLENQNFGNLFLAAMDGISKDFNEAVKKTCSVLAVQGRVIPVTLDNINLCAKLKNNKIVKGESNIPKECIKDKTSIERVYIEPKQARAIDDAIEAILDAHAIILGPGSLYTSVIPNLLVNGIREAIESSNGVKIYVSNILTQEGESDNYSVEDHIKAIQKHSSDKLMDYVIVNDSDLDEEEKKMCVNNQYSLVKLDKKRNKKLKVHYIKGKFIKLNEEGYVKHDEEKLAEVILETVLKKSLFNEDKKVMEMFYLPHMLKELKKNREKG